MTWRLYNLCECSATSRACTCPPATLPPAEPADPPGRPPLQRFPPTPPGPRPTPPLPPPRPPHCLGAGTRIHGIHGLRGQPSPGDDWLIIEVVSDQLGTARRGPCPNPRMPPRASACSGGGARLARHPSPAVWPAALHGACGIAAGRRPASPPLQPALPQWDCAARVTRAVRHNYLRTEGRQVPTLVGPRALTRATVAAADECQASRAQSRHGIDVKVIFTPLCIFYMKNH